MLSPSAASFTRVGSARPPPEIRIIHNPGRTPQEDKANRITALAAGREVLAPEDRRGVIFAVEVMPDGVNARFRDAVSRFINLPSLRCTLH